MASMPLSVHQSDLINQSKSFILSGIFGCSSPYRVDNIYTGNKKSTNGYCQQFLRSQLLFFQQLGHPRGGMTALAQLTSLL